MCAIFGGRADSHSTKDCHKKKSTDKRWKSYKSKINSTFKKHEMNKIITKKVKASLKKSLKQNQLDYSSTESDSDTWLSPLLRYLKNLDKTFKIVHELNFSLASFNRTIRGANNVGRTRQLVVLDIELMLVELFDKPSSHKKRWAVAPFLRCSLILAAPPV